MATNLRTRIDEGFADLGRTVFRHRLKTLLLLAILLGGLLSQLPKLTADNSADVFFRKNDPALIEYNKFKDQFGRDEMVIVAVRPPEVFDAKFLMKLRGLHDDTSDAYIISSLRGVGRPVSLAALADFKEERENAGGSC